MPAAARVMLILILFALPLSACGGGSSNSSGGGNPPPQLAIVDVVIRGTGLSGPWIHMYFDALLAPLSGAAPDVRITPPADIVAMACTESHLVLAQSDGTPAGNRLHIYDDTDTQQPAPTPGVSITLPIPAGTPDQAVIRGLIARNGDIYVTSTYTDASGAPFDFWLITYVFRDVETLTGASAPSATITQTFFTSGAIFSTPFSLDVDDDVLVATGFGEVYLNAAPDALAGIVVPDSTLDQGADLGLTRPAQGVLGGGDLYLYDPLTITAFESASTLFAGQPSLFVLAGPSGVRPVSNGIVEVAATLYSRGPHMTSPIGVVGFEVGVPVVDFEPPLVSLGPPIVSEQFLDGAGGALICGSRADGVASVFIDAGATVDGDQPDLFLFDPDILKMDEVRATER